MNLLKGLMLGTVITAGVIMMYSDNSIMNKKKVIKKGKQMAKKMGII